MQTQSQALFAAGIHALGTDPMLVKVRSDIMRSLWKADTYSMSPFITLSVLAPVQLDPFFGAIYENLRSIMRSMRNVAFRTQIRQRIEREPKYDIDGPSMNLRFLLEHPVVGTVVSDLVQYMNFDEGKFLHDLRERWRNFLWRKVAQTRPEHFAMAEHIDRKRTLAWHDTLQLEADQDDCFDTVDFDKSNVRAQLGILRRLLAGGLMTPERYARHKKLDHSKRVPVERAKRQYNMFLGIVQNIEHSGNLFWTHWQQMEELWKAYQNIFSMQRLYMSIFQCQMF